MSIRKATAEYETWLGSLFPLHAGDLHFKHEQMADGIDGFPFFRATYYRWAAQWPRVCESLAGLPRVVSIGDMHVQNFGTWRDAEGRLCWGVNDFDEADTLAFPHDLVRLAASIRFAKPGGIKFGPACKLLLSNYRESLQAGGSPFVLEENHPELRALAHSADRDPAKFWKKLGKVLDDPTIEPPTDARHALQQSFPAGCPLPGIRHRPQVGLGSLGKPRFLAMTQWNGGWIAREAKALVPAATNSDQLPQAADVLCRAIRSADPHYTIGPKWIVRRLAPRCGRIELTELTPEACEVLVKSMGAEIANVHLGTAGCAGEILPALKILSDAWLENAAKAMAETVEEDWADWRK